MAAVVPTRAYSFLERKRLRLIRRRARLEAELKDVLAELKAVEAAWTAISANQSGRVPKILKGVKLTKKDWVLAAVRARPPKGKTRAEIADWTYRKGVEIPASSITTYLYRLREEGFVEFREKNGRWYAI